MDESGQGGHSQGNFTKEDLKRVRENVFLINVREFYFQIAKMVL